ncbi:hypothetical protein [Caballeronia sp. M23-90]
MSDLLAAASLLATVVTILYSLWYPELVKILEIRPADFKEDNEHNRSVVRRALRGKAFPLAILAVCVGAVFLPDAVSICVESYEGYAQSGFGQFSRYDAVRTALVLVVAVSILLAWHIISLTGRLSALWLRLGK